MRVRVRSVRMSGGMSMMMVVDVIVRVLMIVVMSMTLVMNVNMIVIVVMMVMPVLQSAKALQQHPSSDHRDRKSGNYAQHFRDFFGNNEPEQKQRRQPSRENTYGVGKGNHGSEQHSVLH